MGRRSVRAERRQQILVGFEHCIAEHGLAGVTLERVAEYAGVGRAAIRHNVGNRDALIEAALQRIAERHRRQYASLVAALPGEDRVEALMRYLFVGAFSGPLDAEDVVLDELFAVRHREPKVAELLASTYRDLESTIAGELVACYPRAGRARCKRVAYLIMSLAFGHSTFNGLIGGARRGRATLDCARELVAQLAAPD